MNRVTYRTIYALVFFSTLPLPSLSQENANQLPGLLKFANDYEEKKIKQGMEGNQPYNSDLSGIQLPQLKLKMLNRQIQALTINERQYKIRLQQQERELLQVKLNKINNDLLFLLNKKNIQQKLKQQEELKQQVEDALKKSNSENLNLNNNIKLLSQRIEESEKAQKMALLQIVGGDKLIIPFC
ncbi:hypothetical protein AB7315_12110 [Providencia manganoxydans]|uniref:hypothetical protein n=1 Tax=Providencia manganoxydans TaxID=2923283 RepID=UPI0034E48F76